MLADINGQTLGLLDAVRGGDGLAGAIDPHTPMIVLTGRADELERVRVFDRGGDDVVSKPFSYPELRGRIRALLRRIYEPLVPRGHAHRGADHRHRARDGARRRTPGQAVARRSTTCWSRSPASRRGCSPARSCCAASGGYATFGRTRTLDSHAARLRHKLVAAEPGRRLVINVWGVGYRLTDGPLHQSEEAAR